MTRGEFGDSVMYMERLYPKNRGLLSDDSATMEVWYSELKSYDIKDAISAIRNHIADPNKGAYFPQLSDIINGMRKKLDVSWNEVYTKSIKTIAKYGIYQRAEGLAALDDISRCIVERIGYDRICNSKINDPEITREFKEGFEEYRESAERIRIDSQESTQAAIETDMM